MAMKRDAWLSLVPADPRPVLLASDEPFARFVTTTAVLGASEQDAEVRAARQAVVADPRVRALVDRLPSWESGFTFGGHNSPAFPPNLLRLLHGMGVRGGDFPAIERMLDQMSRHQADDGRYLTPGGTTGKKPSAWASLPCDHFAIVEVLLLFGRTNAPGIDQALGRIRDTLVETTQGPAWHCIPDPVAKWRGPGRKNDACLQVTVEACPGQIYPGTIRMIGLMADSARAFPAEVVLTNDQAHPLRAGQGCGSDSAEKADSAPCSCGSDQGAAPEQNGKQT